MKSKTYIYLHFAIHLHTYFKHLSHKLHPQTLTMTPHLLILLNTDFTEASLNFCIQSTKFPWQILPRLMHLTVDVHVCDKSY